MSEENIDIPPITSTLDKYTKVWRPKKHSVKNEIMISLRNPRVDGHIIYAATLLMKKKYSFVIVKAAGNACTRATLIAEILKSRVENLHQINRINHIEIEDIYEPKEIGLNEVKITKSIPIFEIILTIEDPIEKINNNPDRKLIFDLEDANTISMTEEEFKIGYQAPTKEKIKPFEPNQLGRRRNTGRLRKTKLLGAATGKSRYKGEKDKDIKAEKEPNNKKRNEKNEVNRNEGGRYQFNKQEGTKYEANKNEGGRIEQGKYDKDKYDGKRFEKRGNYGTSQPREGHGAPQNREGHGASQNREGHGAPQNREVHGPPQYRESQNREVHGAPQNREYRESQNREGHGAPQNREYRELQNREGHGAPQNKEYRAPQNREGGTYQNREGYGAPQNREYGESQNKEYRVPQNREYGESQNRDYGTSQNREIYGPNRGTHNSRGERYIVRGQNSGYRNRGGRGTGGRGGQFRGDNRRQEFSREEGDIRQVRKFDREGSIERTKKRRLSEDNVGAGSRGRGFTTRGRGFTTRGRGFAQGGRGGNDQFIRRGGRSEHTDWS